MRSKEKEEWNASIVHHNHFTLKTTQLTRIHYNPMLNCLTHNQTMRDITKKSHKSLGFLWVLFTSTNKIIDMWIDYCVMRLQLLDGSKKLLTRGVIQPSDISFSLNCCTKPQGFPTHYTKTLNNHRWYHEYASIIGSTKNLMYWMEYSSFIT